MNLNEHKNDIIAISSLLIIITAITLLLLNIDCKVGVYYVRDVFFYLNNALFYAGYDTGMEATRGLSPLIPMITSIFFRLGFIADTTIIIVSSVFYIFAALGMYFLLRLKFNEVLSFTGSMILSTFPLVIVWVTKGMLDIPAMCISIWTIYFTILSFRKNTKFLYIAFPLAIFGFFARFTALMTIPVVLIQFLLLKEPITYIKNNIKDIIAGMGLGAIVFSIFIGIYYYFNIGMFFLSQGEGISNSTSNTAGGTAAIYVFYYIKNFLIYIGTENYIPYSLKPGSFIITKMQWIGGYPSITSYILTAILVIGLILSIKKLFNGKNREILKNETNKLELAVFLVFLVLFFITYVKVSVIISIILVSIAALALYRILSKAELNDFTLDFIMFYWFIVNFTFFTYYHIKVDRYFMPMLPFVAYFVIISLSLIFDKLKSSKHIDKIKIAAPIGLICLILLCSGVFALGNAPHTFDNQMHSNFETAASEEKAVCEWLTNYDSDYINKTIWADRGGDMSFNLKMIIPSCEKAPHDSNFTNKLVKNNVTYFIANYNNTIGQPYTKLYQNGEVSLYYYEPDN